MASWRSIRARRPRAVWVRRSSGVAYRVRRKAGPRKKGRKDAGCRMEAGGQQDRDEDRGHRA